MRRVTKLDRIHQRLARAASGQWDAVAVYRKETDRVSLVAWVGDDPPRLSAPLSLPPLGTCARDGEAVVLEKTHARPEKYRSIALVPIKRGSEVLGVLSCASRVEHFFRDPSRGEAARALARELEPLWEG